MSEQEYAFTDYSDMAHIIARSVARSYSMVEIADIVQELALWWYDHPRAVKRYLEDENQKAGEKKLARAFKNAARRYAEKEKARAAGYNVNDVFWYNTGALRELLPLIWADKSALTFGVKGPDDGQPRRKAALNEGNNLLAMLADVERGLEKLPPNHESVIWMVFHGGLDYDELAQELKTTRHAAEQRVQRALEVLVDKLGGEQPYFDGPGSRRAVSNASAIANTRNTYDE